MREARQRLFWHRAGPLAAVAVLAGAATTNVACSSSSPNGTSTSTSTSGSAHTSASSSGHTTTSSTGSSSSGIGGSTTTTTSSGATTSSSSGAGGSITSAVSTATLVANVPNPLDAVPDPKGKTIYFTAFNPAEPTGTFGIYSAPADGSNTTPATVSVGLGAPIGITISTDGSTLYVADPGYTLTGSGVPSEYDGVIVSVPSAGGGSPTIIAQASGYEIRGLDLAQVNGADTLYFSGIDKSTGKPGVFTMPVTGAPPTALVLGTFVQPSGVAVADDGIVYVVDAAGNAPTGAGTQTGQVYAIDTANSNKVTAVGEPVAVGYPSGLAISLDQKTLLVSSHDPNKRTDGIYQIEVAAPNGNTTFTSATVSGTEAAGLHRAATDALFAWVDTAAGTAGGSVFAVK